MNRRLAFTVLFAILSVQAMARAQMPGGPMPGGPQYPGGQYPPGPGVYNTGMQTPPPMASPYEGGPSAAGEASMGDCDDCMPWCNCKWSVFGEFLYIRPRNDSVPYGVPFNGPPNVPPGPGEPIPLQAGPVGVSTMLDRPAFRAGLTRSLDDESAIQLTYTRFEGTSDDTINADGNPNLIRSLVSQPSTWVSNAFSDYLTAEGINKLQFDLGDIDYRWTFAYDKALSVTLLGGIRYASITQDFVGNFTSATAETVHSHIRFEGAGLRLGLEAERRGEGGFLVYGKGSASFVPGSFRGSYDDSPQLAPDQVDTTVHSDSIVTMVDLELGVGWASPGGRIKLTSGYLISSWSNMTKTTDLINAVQNNNFTNLSNGTIMFDGFVSRAEIKF